MFTAVAYEKNARSIVRKSEKKKSCGTRATPSFEYPSRMAGGAYTLRLMGAGLVTTSVTAS